MRLARVFAVVRRHAYEARHNVDRVTDAFYWPVIDVMMWGFFVIGLAQITHAAPLHLGSSVLGAAIVWGLFRATQRDMANGFLAELWSRNLSNLLATPLSVGEYMAGLLLITFGKALIGMAMAALIAWWLYGFDFLATLPGILPFLLEVLLFAIAVGVLVIALVFRYSTRVQSLAWNLTGLLMPLSCVFYPPQVLPPMLRPFAWALPTAHAFAGVRATLDGKGFATGSFLAALILDLVYFAASLAIFQLSLAAARSSGMLVRVE
jgi:ABC-2 type transport system permease protein